MIFLATVIEPYIDDGCIGWRPNIPILVVASDREAAIKEIKYLFPVRLEAIERLLDARDGWTKGNYRMVRMASVPDDFKGALPVFGHVQMSKAETFYI